LTMETITRKSLLYRSGVEYADFSLNHVVGCSHGCKYPCYAFLLKKRFGAVKTYKEWCNPRLVSNSMELLEIEIPKYRKIIHYVHLCFSTDPFMYGQDEVSHLTIKILEKLNESGIPCTILTKGVFPEEIANNPTLSGDNKYGISIVSLDESFRETYEPYAAIYRERLKSLRYLHKKGLATWVSIEPYPPPNLIEQDFDELLNAVSFVNRIVFGKLNYNSRVSEFKKYKEHYNLLASKVIQFCKKKGIDYYIKEGTQT